MNMDNATVKVKMKRNEIEGLVGENSWKDWDMLINIKAYLCIFIRLIYPDKKSLQKMKYVWYVRFLHGSWIAMMSIYLIFSLSKRGIRIVFLSLRKLYFRIFKVGLILINTGFKKAFKRVKIYKNFIFRFFRGLYVLHTELSSSMRSFWPWDLLRFVLQVVLLRELSKEIKKL